MANYTKVFTKPYADGYEDLPSQTTPITAETLNDKDDTLEHIEDYLYDNPIAEVVDNLTTNDATKALSAKQGKILNDTKLNVADLPNSDVQTSTTGQFTTVTGGLMQSCVVDLEPVQSGSGTPSPSNVRPISGHTQVKVRNWGKNKLNYNAWKSVNIQNGTAVFENNGVTLTATANDCYTRYAADFPTDARIPISEGETITISWKETSNKSGLVIIFPNATVTGAVYVDNANVKSLSYTATSGVTFVTFRFGVQNSGNTIEYKDIQIERGSQATEFTPFNGYTTTINLGGTYYGGTLDAVSGVLTVTHGIGDLGALTYTAVTVSDGTLFYTGLNPFTNIKSISPRTEIPNAFCSIMGVDSFSNVNTGRAEGLSIGDDDARIRIFSNSAYKNMSASDFKTAMSGAQLAYELATPQTIQLTPTQIDTLVGQNNVFAPLTGQSIEEVEFREVMTWDDVNKAVEFTDANNLINAVKVGKTVTVNIACDSFAMVGRMSEDAWDYITSEALPEEMRPQKTIHANILNILTLGGGYSITSIPCRINTTGIIEAFLLHQQTAQPYGTITYDIK